MQDSGFFCILEKDQKTYEYLSRFFTCKLSGDHLFKLENMIQIEEIRHHLSVNSCMMSDSKEKIQWVASHAASFRSYLETIKYAMERLCQSAQGTSARDLSWEQFCHLVDTVNQDLHQNSRQYSEASVN
jgi:hypothetical protein